MNDTLTYRKIFIFWTPLALMWLFMSVEQPLIAATLTRLPNLKENLAAFGMSFALAMALQSPVIQLLSAGNVLVKSKSSYAVTLSFANRMFVVISILHLIFCWPPLFNFVALKIIGVPASIVELSWQSFLIFFPLSAAVGYRRFWLGILIGSARTKPLTSIMIYRLLAMAAVLIWGLFYPVLSGANLGALTMTLGVIAGALFTWYYVRPVLKELPEKDELPTSLTATSRFYFPLAMTSIINMCFRPILTIGLSRAPNPLESLAVWPVLIGFVSLFRGVTISYQEVVIALIAEGRRRFLLQRFSDLTGIFQSVLMLFLAFWPFSRRLWFQTICGLPDELMVNIHVALYVLALVPFITMHISWFRGLNVGRRRTTVVSVSVLINASVLVAVMFGLPVFFDFSGTLVVSIAYVASLLAEMICLALFSQKN